MSRRIAVIVCGIVLSSATPALAQMQWTDKGFASVSGGMQVGSPDVNTATTFDQYGETASMSSATDMKAGMFVDFQAGYRVWRNLAIGAGYTFVTAEGDSTITASVPDPILFDAPRSVSASATGLGRSESWISGLLTWGVPVTDKIDILISGGPAFVSISQDMPSSATVSEPGPSLAVTATEQSESGIGFVAGADVRYMITSRLGIGVMGKFSAASVDFGDDKVEAGGFQLGAGVRFRF